MTHHCTPHTLTWDEGDVSAYAVHGPPPARNGVENVPAPAPPQRSRGRIMYCGTPPMRNIGKNFSIYISRRFNPAKNVFVIAPPVRSRRDDVFAHAPPRRNEHEDVFAHVPPARSRFGTMLHSLRASLVLLGGCVGPVDELAEEDDATLGDEPEGIRGHFRRMY